MTLTCTLVPVFSGSHNARATSRSVSHVTKWTSEPRRAEQLRLRCTVLIKRCVRGIAVKHATHACTLHYKVVRCTCIQIRSAARLLDGTSLAAAPKEAHPRGSHRQASLSSIPCPHQPGKPAVLHDSSLKQDNVCSVTLLDSSVSSSNSAAIVLFAQR